MPPTPAPRIKLWPDLPPAYIAAPEDESDPAIPTLDIYLAPKNQASGAAVLVLPGGGYGGLALGHEGETIARFFNDHHLSAFVLRYRHAPRHKHPVPLHDAQRALRLLRSKSTEFQFDPHRLGILGFSAGGHLAATTSTLFSPPTPSAPDPIDRLSDRPDFSILIYPVISFMNETLGHEGSRSNLTGDDPALYPTLSAERLVTAQTPPTFLLHANEDAAVPSDNSLLYYSALRKAGVPAELHLLQKGPHGFGIQPTPYNPAAPDWTFSTRHWPDLLAHWLRINGHCQKS